MKANIGGVDRVIRIILGLGVVAASVYFCKETCTYKNWILALGTVVALTGVIGWCGAYALCRCSTVKKKAVKAKATVKAKAKSKKKKK